MSPPSSSFVVTAHSHSTAPEAPTTEPLSVVNECRGVHTKTPRKERRGSDSTGDTTSSASTVSDNYVEDATPFGISKSVKTSNEPFVYESESNATIELKRMLNLDSSASSHVTESREAPTIVDTDDAEVRKKFASTTHWPSNSSMSDTSSGSPPLEEQEHIQDPEASPRRQQQYSPQQRQQQQMTSIFPVPHPHPDVLGVQRLGYNLERVLGCLHLILTRLQQDTLMHLYLQRCKCGCDNQHRSPHRVGFSYHSRGSLSKLVVIVTVKLKWTRVRPQTQSALQRYGGR